MSDVLEDLQLPEEATYQEALAIIEEKLGVKFSELTAPLNEYLKEHAESIAGNFLVMTPFENYADLIEEQPQMVQFLRTRAAQSENWLVYHLGTSQDPKFPDMIAFCFINKAVDDGDSLTGYVFINRAGKVMHAFVQGDP